ncbi:HAD family hydrolase [Mechercharimyces sp. CAU 1602]|uniref:HAD family hydrolase n=1 Tax=Mechercharimyces sp. CAU 1602 TaxID=2973933 RepID=UPI002162C1B4|nr:HAD family hydrolase [Mechercharimyces sp. CAU 1602]MCS1350022.1 HAD hydrolase-like protein [Mechercharimyces sp. CAU 1602]
MYKYILFDVDGVLLSEERCFDASALAVWEMLYHDRFVGLPQEDFILTPSAGELKSIRAEVFCEDEILVWLKQQGMNSNWDMVTVVFGWVWGQLLSYRYPSTSERNLFLQSNERLRDQFDQLRKSDAINGFVPDFSSFLSVFPGFYRQGESMLVALDRYMREQGGVDSSFCLRTGELWALGRDLFQEWYLGDDRYEGAEGKKPRTRGKKGFLDQEVPLAKPEAIYQVLEMAKKQGSALGIGTGRPRVETVVPLTQLGLLSAFDEHRVVTATEVLSATKRKPDQSWGKPHPYTYVQGYIGTNVHQEQAMTAVLPLPQAEEILVVGDSVADLLAARKMGAHFAATLTGLMGEKARDKFIELQADYVLQDVTQLPTVWGESQQ